MLIIIKMKKYTTINKNDLFSYLDGYYFVNTDEIEMAICDYIQKKEWTLYYSDCAFACELMNEYINKKELYDIDYMVDWKAVDFSKWF